MDETTKCIANTYSSKVQRRAVDPSRNRLGPQYIDPRSGRSVTSTHSVVVHAPTAAVADALSKVALMCPTTASRVAPALQAQWRAFDFFAPAAEASVSLAHSP